MERIGLKAPGNHSASIWTDTFSLCLCEKPKPNISMISEFLRPIGTLICWFEYAKALQPIKKSKKLVQIYYCLKIWIWEIWIFEMWEPYVHGDFEFWQLELFEAKPHCNDFWIFEARRNPFVDVNMPKTLKDLRTIQEICSEILLFEILDWGNPICSFGDLATLESSRFEIWEFLNIAAFSWFLDLRDP